MTSKIKVDNIANQSDSNIVNKCSTTITVGTGSDTTNVPGAAVVTGNVTGANVIASGNACVLNCCVSVISSHTLHNVMSKFEHMNSGNEVVIGWFGLIKMKFGWIIVGNDSLKWYVAFCCILYVGDVNSDGTLRRMLCKFLILRFGKISSSLVFYHVVYALPYAFAW